MRLSVVKEDGFYTVVKDGVPYDLETLPIPSQISALQWDGEECEIEYTDCRKNPNKRTKNTELVDACCRAWQQEKDRHEREMLEREEALRNSWDRIRLERNALLRNTDWVMLPDVEISAEDFKAVKRYRKALRDITKTFKKEGAAKVIWPEKPHVITAMTTIE